MIEEISVLDGIDPYMEYIVYCFCFLVDLNFIVTKLMAHNWSLPKNCADT